MSGVFFVGKASFPLVFLHLLLIPQDTARLSVVPNRNPAKAAVVDDGFDDIRTLTSCSAMCRDFCGGEGASWREGKVHFGGRLSVTRVRRQMTRDELRDQSGKKGHI